MAATKLIPSCTITLDADEMALVLGSLKQSQRPAMRGIVTRIREQVALPLLCPVSFKDGNAELCGDMTMDNQDDTVINLRNHLAEVHGVQITQAEYDAAVAYKRWSQS